MEFRSIEQLIQATTHYDPDYRFMATKDLTELILKDGAVKDSELDNILNIFLNQLNDENTDVKENSIRSLSRIVNKLSIAHITRVSNNIFQKLMDISQVSYKDVYKSCINSLIQAIPISFASAIAPLLSRIVEGILACRKNSQRNIEEELCEILDTIIRKYSDYFQNKRVIPKEIIFNLIENTIQREYQTLRSRSCNALGSVCLVLQKPEVGDIIETLFQRTIKFNQVFTFEGQKLKYFVLKGLHSVSKSNPNHINFDLILNLLQFLVKDIAEEVEAGNKAEDSDLSNQISEIIEIEIGIYENLVLPRHIDQDNQDRIKKEIERMIKFLPCLITYDPNNSADLGAQNMELENFYEDDDNQYDTTQIDNSWRVRRAGAVLLECFLRLEDVFCSIGYNHCINHTLQERSIIYRLAETNENVLIAYFSCLNQFFKSICKEDHLNSGKQSMEFEEEFLQEEVSLIRVKSQVEELLNEQFFSTFFKQINQIIKNNKISISIKGGAIKLCELISKNFSKTVHLSRTFPQIHQILIDQLKSSSNNEIKVSSLLSLRKFVKYADTLTAEQIQSIIDISEKYHSNTESQRMQIEALRCYNQIMVFLGIKGLDKQYHKKIESFVEFCTKKLSEHNLDQEVKKIILLCNSNILFKLFPIINSDQIREILKNLLEKLKLEQNKKQSILYLLKNLPIELGKKLDENCFKIINQFHQELCTHLQRQDRNLKLVSLETIEILLKLQFTNVTKCLIEKSIAQNIVENISNELNNQEFYLIKSAIAVVEFFIENFSKLGLDYSKFINRYIEVQNSQTMAQNYYGLFEKFTKYGLISQEEIEKILVSKIDKDSVSSIAKCYAYATSNSNQIDSLLKKSMSEALDSNSPPQKRQFKLLYISELGKIKSIFSAERLNAIVQLILDPKQSFDEIKIHASACLSGICLGDINSSLPVLLKVAESQEQHAYLILNALKEIFHCNDAKKQKLIQAQTPQLLGFLNKNAESSDINIRNLTAECIGKLCLLDLARQEDFLQKNLKSGSANVRYTVALSFKYFCIKQTVFANIIPKLIDALQKLLLDKDINVRTVSVKTLNSAAFNLSSLFSNLESQQEMMNSLFSCLAYDKTLIKEVDLGSFKHKVDEGHALRLSSFQLLETMLDTHYQRGLLKFEKAILDVVLKDIDTDPSDDVKVLRFQIISKIFAKQPSVFVSLLNRLKECFEKILRSYLGKNTELERTEDLLKLILTNVVHVSEVAKNANHQVYIDFFELVKKTDQFKLILDNLQLI